MNIRKIIDAERWEISGGIDDEVIQLRHNVSLARIEDAVLKRIAELEAQVESAYKRGYDDGHVVGFQEGHNEKKKDKRIAELERKIPTDKPDPRLIESMAMRFDHSFVMMSAIEKEVLRRQMQQVWEEVVGLGFYNPSLSRGLGRHELELVEKALSSAQQKALSNAFTDNNVARESKTRRIEKMNEQEWHNKETWNDGYAAGKREQYDNTIKIIRKMIDDSYIEINRRGDRYGLVPFESRVNPPSLPFMNVLIKKLEKDFEG